jgi:hypothetical protein
MISTGRVFRAIRKNGTASGDCINVSVVWHAVNRYCRSIGLEHMAPHDLRRTYAKLCHSSGGELEQIQFLLGRAVMRFYEKRGTAEQWIGEGKQAVKMTPLFLLSFPLQPGAARAKPAGLQPREPVAPAGLAPANRGLVTHQLAETAGEDRWPLPILIKRKELTKLNNNLTFL